MSARVKRPPETAGTSYLITSRGKSQTGRVYLTELINYPPIVCHFQCVLANCLVVGCIVKVALYIFSRALLVQHNVSLLGNISPLSLPAPHLRRSIARRTTQWQTVPQRTQFSGRLYRQAHNSANATIFASIGRPGFYSANTSLF